MKRSRWILGALVLCAAGGYAAWRFGLKDRVAGLAYGVEIGEILRESRLIIGRNRPPHTDAQSLRDGAQKLRARYAKLSESISEQDRRRPSFRRAGEIVSQIDHAAQKPESTEIVEARFRTALDEAVRVEATVGTNQDQGE